MHSRALIWMAWRQLRSVRARVLPGTRGLSFMTTMSIAGVATGVMALVVVLSVMAGFEADLRRKMLVGQPHVEVMAENAVAGFSLKEHPLEQIARAVPEAQLLEPFTEADVVIKRKRFMSSATLFGVDPAIGASNWGFNGAFINGGIGDLGARQGRDARDHSSLPGIALGDQLADQLQIAVGDELVVLSPQTGVGSILGGGTLSRSFVVTGIFSTGMFNYDSKWAVTSLDEGRRFMADFDESLAVDRFVSGIGFSLRDPMRVDRVKKTFERALGADSGLRLQTWQEANKSLLFALKLEKFAMGSILMLVVVVAAFSISGTMMMTVFHKRGHVSLMRALGMSRRDVLRLYLIHGVVIGVTGALLGLTVGILLCLAVEFTRGVPLPADIYYLKVLPVKYLPVDYLVIVLAALGFSFAASAYPAWVAAGQDPGAGLRYE
ncbi:ABC transporter permease [bacterium]|nr:ABC transporter permease [bacterium]